MEQITISNISKLYSITNCKVEVNQQEIESKITKKQLDKYSTLLLNKEYYSFLLQIKTTIRKAIKEVLSNISSSNLNENKDKLFSVCFLAVIKLSENEQLDSLNEFIKFLCEEFKKENQLKLEIIDKEFYICLFKFAFEKFPKKEYKKQSIQLSILNLFESKGISQEDIKKSGIYKLFSEDCLLNSDPIVGYKFAIASEDADLLSMFLDLHLDQTESDLENAYFLTRMILELLIQENFKLASYILVKKGFNHNVNKKFNDNKKEVVADFSKDESIYSTCAKFHPLINFNMCLISIINQKSPFEKLVGLLNAYGKWLTNDNGILKKYCNQISVNFYKKPIVREGGMNLLNMLSGFL